MCIKVWNVKLEVLGYTGRLLLQIRYLWGKNDRPGEYRDQDCKS